MRKVLLFACCLIMTVTLSVCVLADNGPEVKACYQVNENQIVIEFSEKIKVEDTAPYMAIRYVTEEGVLAWDGPVDQGTPLQFGGSWEYLDDSHDKIIFTLPINNMGGASTISDILEYKKDLSKYSGYEAKFAFEEVRYDDSDIYDFVICNISSADDDNAKLKANLSKPGWQDGLYLDIEKNFDYVLPEKSEAETPVSEESITENAEDVQDISETVTTVSKGSSEGMVSLPIWEYVLIIGLLVILAPVMVFIGTTKKK